MARPEEAEEDEEEGADATELMAPEVPMELCDMGVYPKLLEAELAPL